MAKKKAWSYVPTILKMIVAISVLMFIFKINPSSEDLKINDYFQFVASVFGAVLGAFVSFKILEITTKLQREDYDKIRRKEDKKWKLTAKQFNVQLEIQVLNDKINDHIQLIENLHNILSSIKGLRYNIDKYMSNINIFKNEIKGVWERALIDLKYKSNLRNTLEGTKVDVFNMDEITASLEEILLIQRISSARAKCLRDEEIKIEYKKLSKDITEFTKNVFDKIDLMQINIYTKTYLLYIENDVYSEFNKDIIEHEKNYYFLKTKIIPDIEEKIAIIEGKINNEINDMYDSKYNISDNLDHMIDEI